jgi:hypothetical protein
MFVHIYGDPLVSKFPASAHTKSMQICVLRKTILGFHTIHCIETCDGNDCCRPVWTSLDERRTIPSGCEKSQEECCGFSVRAHAEIDGNRCLHVWREEIVIQREKAFKPRLAPGK